MSLFYRLAYRLGITPWETAARRGSHLIEPLYAREEQGREASYGRALDLGCGRGLQSIVLAKRGWETTGVDNVPRALEAARKRARDENVNVKFIQGDVTDLRAAGVEGGQRLFLDIGCFHGLNDDQRAAMGREVGAVAEPGATLLLLAWAPGNRMPLPRGASQADIEAAFPGWTVLDFEEAPPDAMPKALRSVKPRFYRLRKAAEN